MFNLRKLAVATASVLALSLPGIAAAEGISTPSPFGEITFRKIDHQSTLGAFTGKTALKDGKGIMVDTAYRKGSDYLPGDAEIEKMRPKD